MARTSPIDYARAWWKERVDAGRYVVSPSEAPSAPIARLLRQERLVLDVAGKRAWILTVPSHTGDRAAFLANYWPVIAIILAKYAPAAVVGVSAVKLYLGNFSPPEELPVHHTANRSDYALPLAAEFTARLRPRPVPGDRLERIAAPGHVEIPVLSPADLLATLDEPEIAAGVEPVSAWLRHLVIRTPDLNCVVDNNPRPFILQRLADMAGELSNKSLAAQLDAAARRITTRVVPPSGTGVGTRIVVPRTQRTAPRGSGTPWLDEQAMRLERQEAEIATCIGAEAGRLPAFAIRTLIANAKQAKAYDAYHSTTMEGYRISREISDAIVRGEPLPDGPPDQKTFEAAMAVQGYSAAFDHVIDLARQRAPVTPALILDIYEELFRPSVDAGIVAAGELRGWRTSNVALRGWRYVPPNHRKIRDLIDGLEAFANRPDIAPLARTLLVHLEFVTIHPFPDGNGRIARLLMNLALMSAGHPWVTIRSDERMPFFRSIERAQVDGETEPFIQFLWHLIRQSAAELASRSAPRRRR